MSPTAFQPDGWRARTRIGVVVPHADVGPEAELQAMVSSEDITIHANRLHFAAMRAGGVMDPKIPHQPVQDFTDPPHVDDAVAALAQAPVDVVALGFTSSAYKLGVEGEQALLDRLSRSTRGIPMVSTCDAAANALTELGAHKLALVNPPWFDADLDGLGAAYFRARGFDVVHHGPAGIPSSQSEITPGLLFDWVKSVAGGADAVFVAGNGQRAVGIIEAVEAELGIAALTANQVLLWRSLRVIDADPRGAGYGRLFRTS